MGDSKFSGAVLLLATLLATACGQQKTSELKYRALKAPQSESQTGFILDLSSEGFSDSQTEEVLKNIEDYGGKIRSINPAHGLFEVVGLSHAQLERLAPSGTFQKNKFWKKKNRKFDSPHFLQSFCSSIPTAPAISFSSAPEDKHFLPEEPNIFLRDGKAITFGAHIAGNNNYRWELFGPPSSSVSGLKSQNRDISFVPDELGEYNLFLVVKISETTACWRRFLIGVTENANYTGPTMEMIRPVDQRLSQFPHLAALNMKNAWAVTEGGGAKIAILDTGVDYNHVDLAGNISLNLSDTSDDNRDNDGNKFLNDYLGWDFVNNDNSPYDDDMHGTHVAGLASSLVGVAPKSTFLAVKVLGPFGGDMGTLAGGIYYAIDRGAKIINMSLGSNVRSDAVVKALDYAEARGVLVVVAAGNDAENIDEKPTYPASLPQKNILVVAATDLSGNLTDYTNIGSASVDIAAPGGSDTDGGLISAFYKNRLGKRFVRSQGTSMASPVVAGLAALVLSQNPSYKATDIIKKIVAAGVSHPDYQSRIASQKMVSAATLLTVDGPRP